jgi:hypothetical protein
MNTDTSGDTFDYKTTMQPERPWVVDWHQRFVYRHINALRGGTGMYSGDPEMAAARPQEHRWVFGDGKTANVCLPFEHSLAAIRNVSNLTCNVPQMILLTGWQYEGHDSKYPAWGEVCPHLKRAEDDTALESLRWLFREARSYNCLVTLHVNMFDAYADSPLFDEYVEKDIIAKDLDGNPIIGNRWSGMDCYHISYVQEWKHGLAQKRIDGLLEMVPELRENGCVYLDAFLGARMKDQEGPISPYLGYSKEDEAAAMRKILRYWREQGVDPGVEHAWGMRVDRCVGLTPYVAASHGQYDLPDSLMTTSPYHAAFHAPAPPVEFVERFCLETLPYLYHNNPDANYDYGSIHEATDICVPALWCDEPTLIAYSKTGHGRKKWPLPPAWRTYAAVQVSRLTVEGPVPRERLPIEPGGIYLSLAPGEAVCITPVL